jgi:protein TonB
VLIEVLVDRQGRVADLRLSDSSGYTVLDQAALLSVKTWLFDPGTRGGETVEMWVKVPVRFRLD